MESRDDDAPPMIDADDQIMPVVASSSSFINDELKKTFNQGLESLAQTLPIPPITKKASGIGMSDDNNPATVSKQAAFGVNRPASHVSLLSTSGEKSTYDNFMSKVDSASKAYGAQSIHVADLYVNMGIDCSRSKTANTKSKQLALLLFKEAFSIYQAKSGDSHEHTVTARLHLGRTYHSLGKYDEALDCFCMAVYMREALLGELHPSVSEIWVLIASVHQAKAKLELALKASAKALTGYRNANGDKHRTVIDVLKTIAQIHTEMGNHDKAVDIQKY
ncbi:hypothetical protein ACHAXR_000627, partial [Thalassiosira sp. AJA248-18]